MAKLSTNKTKTHIDVTFNLKGEKWDNFISKAEKAALANIELKGFQKGKVPIELAKKSINMDAVRAHAADEAIKAQYEKVFGELTKERIVSQPEITVTKISDDELEAKFTSALWPEVKLGDLSKLTTKFTEQKVEASELKAEIEKLTNNLKETIKVEDVNHKVADGEIANIDFTGYLGDKPFDNGDAKGFDLTIGSKSFIEGFEDQVIGMIVGQEKEINVTFPKTYPVEELAGQPVKFDVKLNSISQVVTLKGKELDEKIKQFGYNSFKEMEDKINKQLTMKKEQEVKNEFVSKVIEEIIELKDTNFNVPKEMVEQEINREIEHFTTMLKNQGMKFSDYLSSMKKTQEQLISEEVKPRAEKFVKDSLIFQQLIADFKINVSDKDIEDQYNKLVELEKVDLETIKKEVPVASISNVIQFDKLIDLLKKNTK